ncbi:MAG: hypothetical protein ACI4GD_00535 [Lachnospiraceae bacterium]
MKNTEYLGLNIPEAADFADIKKVASNFPLLDAELKKANNNTAAIKAALTYLSSSVILVDDYLGTIYKLGAIAGKLYFEEITENMIAELADKIDTEASVVEEDSGIKTLSLVSLNNVATSRIGVIEKIEEETEE